MRTITILSIFAASCGGLEGEAARTEPLAADQTACGPYSTVTQAVIGGELFDHPAVGLLDNGCTATLVASDRVLTAAHCVRGRGPAVVTFPGGRRGVLGGRVYPGYRHDLEGREDLTSTLGVDLAVLRLAVPVGFAAPVRLATSAPEVCEGLTVVGYGDDGEGSTLQRRGSVTVAGVSVDAIRHLGAQTTCHGDSGGPVLNDAGELVGVTSTGDCVTVGWSVSTLRYAGWILQDVQTDR